MAIAHAFPMNTTCQPLTPNGLRRDFGAGAAVTRDGVRALHDALESASPATFDAWRSHFGNWAGGALDRVPRHLAKLAGRYGVSTATNDSASLLLAMQTYYALLVTLVASRLLGGNRGEILPESPFTWYAGVASEAVQRLVDRVTEALANYEDPGPTSSADGGCDLFKPLYEDLFPRPLRQQLGEYYTPDWLAGHVLDQVGYTGRPARGCSIRPAAPAHFW